jgi:lipopolysaccharide transport system permease protein
MQRQRPSVPPVLVIEPARGFGAFRPKELWAFWAFRAFWDYRELLYFLVWRDVKVRYKQTALGAAWAVLQPALGAGVFSRFFGRLAGIGSDGVPYPLFAYAGLMVWTFFSQGVTLAANSLVGSANLITKVFFPRAAIPTAAVLSGLVDLAVAFPVLGVLLLAYRVRPGSALLALPLPLALGLASALGAGLWLAALNVEYRDVRHVVPFFLQIWLFLTPVIYPASRVEGWLRQNGLPAWLVGINPMAGAVEGFRWALLRPQADPGPLLAVSSLTAALLLLSGLAYFRSVERSFADVV